MKINAKLGGTNVRLAGGQREAMPHIGNKAAMFIGKCLLASCIGWFGSGGHCSSTFLVALY